VHGIFVQLNLHFVQYSPPDLGANRLVWCPDLDREAQLLGLLAIVSPATAT
jgi:hypothetical protein